MESNFQKYTFLESSTEDLEPRGRHIVEGRSLLERGHEHGDCNIILSGSCGDAQVAQHRGSRSLCDYELLCAMRIYQADYIGIAHVIQTNGLLDSLRDRRVLFS